MDALTQRIYQMSIDRPAEFSHLIDISNGTYDLTLWVRPDFDIDSQFDAICDDTGERLTINGWFFEVI